MGGASATPALSLSSAAKSSGGSIASTPFMTSTRSTPMAVFTSMAGSMVDFMAAVITTDD